MRQPGVLTRSARPYRMYGNVALSSVHEVQIAPCTAPYFSLLVQSKVSKRNTPQHTGLAALDFPHSGAVPRVASKGHPWPIVPHLASMPNAPLHSACTRPSDGDPGAHCSACVGWKTPPAAFPPSGALVDNAARLSTLRITFRHARTDGPVRRVSGIGVEGVERHGCRESCDGPGTALRSMPLERLWSERTLSAQRPEPDVGCVSSWLLLLAAQQEEVTRRARRRPEFQPSKRHRLHAAHGANPFE